MMEIAENGIVVAMVVRDAEAVLDFYQNTLGMRFGWSSPMDEGGMKHYLIFKGGLLKLFAPDEKPEISTGKVFDTTGYRLLNFKVTNLEVLAKVIEEKGARILVPYQKTGKGSSYMVIADPEKNLIEFSQDG